VTSLEELRLFSVCVLAVGGSSLFGPVVPRDTQPFSVVRSESVLSRIFLLMKSRPSIPRPVEVVLRVLFFGKIDSPSYGPFFFFQNFLLGPHFFHRFFLRESVPHI